MPDHEPATARVRSAANEADRSAVRAIRGGDREAFGRLVEAYQDRLFSLTAMMLRDPSAAQDATQDAFIRALKHIDTYDENRPFYPWLATIAVRSAQEQLRRRGREHGTTPSIPARHPTQPPIR